MRHAALVAELEACIGDNAVRVVLLSAPRGSGVSAALASFAEEIRGWGHRADVVDAERVGVQPGGAVDAHHSIAGYYNTSREATIDGVVAEFQFVNPHPFLVVEVRRNGAAERWQLDMDNRFELAQIGFTETTLRPGDRIVVAGSPAHREPRRLYIQRLERPADGFAYEQVGNRPERRSRAR
jgi:hypothetical protein